MKTIAQRKEIERVAVLIPAYREPHSIAGVVTKARKFFPDVIVVDDASGDLTAERARLAGATVLQRAVNGGKGGMASSETSPSLSIPLSSTPSLVITGYLRQNSRIRNFGDGG